MHFPDNNDINAIKPKDNSYFAIANEAAYILNVLKLVFILK